MPLIIKKYKNNLLIFLFFVCFLPLFFYNLGSFGLDDFDEAWYGEIARNILANRNPIFLSFNHLPYYDHPPLGFNLIAISYLFFGINEFTVRFPSAILGFLSVFLLYLVGKEAVNKFVGLASSLILLSCVWFVFRSRSGNLDSIFLFFYLLTFFAAVKIKKNPDFIYLFFVSLSCVLLVKSLIGFSILIPSVIYLWNNKTRLITKKIALGIFLFFIIISPWIIGQIVHGGLTSFITLFNFATRSGTHQPIHLSSFFTSNTMLYLHYGIGKWYYPFLLSFVISMIFVRKNRVFLSLYAIIIFLIFGFAANSKTEIWHLIIIYPFIGLFISSCLYYSIDLCITISNRLKLKISYKERQIIFMMILFLIFIISARQIYQFRNNVRLNNSGLQDLAFVSSFAKGRTEKLYLDGSDFLPSVVFYSQKRVHFLRYENPPINSLKDLPNIKEGPFLLLTEKWRMDIDKVDWENFQVLAEKNGYVLLLSRY